MRIGALQISNSWIWQYVERRDTKPFPNFVCRVCDKQYATGGAIDSICCHFRKKKQSEEVYRVSFDALTNAEYDVQQLEIAEDVDLENLPRIFTKIKANFPKREAWRFKFNFKNPINTSMLFMTHLHPNPN